MPQKKTLDSAAYTCMLSILSTSLPQFQFSLSGVTLVYLSQWGKRPDWGLWPIPQGGGRAVAPSKTPLIMLKMSAWTAGQLKPGFWASNSWMNSWQNICLRLAEAV